MGIQDFDRVFSIKTDDDFKSKCFETFHFQYHNNSVYKSFCDHLGKLPSKIDSIKDIPFLPIQFFKSHTVISDDTKPEIIFKSSGTTGMATSQHHVINKKWYEQSFLSAFELFYGPVDELCVLALLPSYLEREGSSLVYMANALIEKSKHPDSGFHLYDFELLKKKLIALEEKKVRSLLIGVSFALLDFSEKHPLSLSHCTVMETGGMKGRRKEMIRNELHTHLKKGFGVDKIHSEYGMTELLSQAYSKGGGRFFTPPWMKIFIRDTEDPLQLLDTDKTGGINVIDLANTYSCSFIATQDLGKSHIDGSFEVLGRFDHSDVRGCNLMAL